MKSYQTPVLESRHARRHEWTAALSRLAACGLASWAACGVVAYAAADTAKTVPAKATVVAFLDAVKRGDDATARSLLTTVARAKTEEMGMSVAPPVADSATYAVRDCELVTEAGDVAHVATVWTDVAADGSKSSENVVWVVRLDPEGWRVVGMAMRVFEDMPPLLLNFEDPDDMLAKQEMVATELEKRSRQPAEAQGPGPRTAQGQAAGSRQ